MAILEILTIPDDRLRQKAQPVEAITPEIIELLDHMLETMYDAQGIGLAATQLGIMKRIIIVDVAQREKNTREPIFLINPEITWLSEEVWEYEEGCLSIPGSYAKVIRPEKAIVSYLDRTGKQQEITGFQLLSSALQHEIDHLDGVLFIDHISKLKRSLIERKHTKRKQRKGDAL